MEHRSTKHLSDLASGALKLQKDLGIPEEQALNNVISSLQHLYIDKMHADLRGRFEQLSLHELKSLMAVLEAPTPQPQEQNARKAPSRARR